MPFPQPWLCPALWQWGGKALSGCPQPPAPHCPGRVRRGSCSPRALEERRPWGTIKQRSLGRALWPWQHPQGWQPEVAKVATQPSPCPTSAACGSPRPAPAATCAAAAGGGGSLREGAIRSSKGKGGWGSRCSTTFPAGKLLDSTLGCPGSRHSWQPGTEWRSTMPEHHPRPSCAHRRLSAQLGWLRQASLSFPSQPPWQHRPPPAGTVGSAPQTRTSQREVGPAWAVGPRLDLGLGAVGRARP